MIVIRAALTAAGIAKAVEAKGNSRILLASTNQASAWGNLAGFLIVETGTPTYSPAKNAAATVDGTWIGDVP
jgi:hypothetical protein